MAGSGIRSRPQRLVLGAAAALIGIGAVVVAEHGLDSPSTRAGTRVGSTLHPLAGNFAPDATSLGSCESSDTACLGQAFGNIAFHLGPNAALTLFDRSIAANRAVEAACHPIAHMIGSATLARYEGDLGRAFAEGSSSCWSGYYHGILERALAGTRGPEALARTARDLCSSPVVRKTTFSAYNCVHGLGHGFMITTGLDLPLALRICEQLDSAWDQTSCDGGVFMENFNTSYGVRSTYLKDGDPVYPCNWVHERHKLYCYLQVTDNILPYTGYDWPRAAQICAEVEQAWVSTCFQSFGRSASGIARRENRAVVDFCAGARAHGGEGDCYYGAARDMVAQDAGPRRATGFCASAPQAIRGRCFYGIGTILSDLVNRDAERLARACEAVPRTFFEHCRLVRTS